MTRFIETPALLDGHYQSTYSKGRGDLAKIKLTVEDCGAPIVSVQHGTDYDPVQHFDRKKSSSVQQNCK